MIVLFETPAGYSLFKVREINASDGSRFSRFSDVSNKFMLYCSFTSCIFYHRLPTKRSCPKPIQMICTKSFSLLLKMLLRL